MTTREQLILEHSGSSLEDRLRRRGRLEESNRIAAERVEAWKNEQKQAAIENHSKQPRHLPLVHGGRPTFCH
jgi:hypothetical protein